MIAHAFRHECCMQCDYVIGSFMRELMKDWLEKPRVLIVDDDTEFISDLKVLLSSEFEILAASGTRRAMEILSERQPDCLLLDLNMPEYFGKDPKDEGLSFLKYLREDADPRMAARLPVIVLTARQGENPIENAGEYGIAGLYRKPPDIKHLKTAIWKLVEGINGNPS